MMKKFSILIVMLIITASFVLAVTPRHWEGNPTCADVGYTDSFYKIDPPIPGSYTFNGIHIYTWIADDDLIYFNWTSTYSLDAVICKGGNDANVYDYDPASFGDNDLHCPVNPSGGPAEISHILICYNGGNEIPEFTTIGAALALAGAGLYIFKKRNRG